MYFHRLSLSILLLFFSFIPTTVWSQPTANFSANNTQGCAPFSLVVNFQDLSTGSPTSWLWRFGDANGSSSTLQNPTFVYNSPGCYDVTLIATNASGSDTLVQSCFVEILPQPEPGFTIDMPAACVPATVCFTDTSVANGGTITDWQWTLSDGSPGSGPNPCFSFSMAPDTIGVVLTVTNSNGCQATQIFPDVVILYEPPVLDFTVDVNSGCTPPLTVNLSNTTQENGAINPQYTWYFPGGIVVGGVDTAAGFNPPPVTYNSSGQFDVQLIVQTDNGCADTLLQPNFIGIGGVVADFTTSDTVVCLGTPISFTNTSTGGVSSLGWNFGENPGIDATSQNPSYTYAAPGTYTVTLEANNSQCGDTLIRVNHITVLPVPTASFSKDRDEDCQPGIPFVFTDQSSGATSWSWDFGDTNTSNQQNPSHTYTSFGVYPICLTVTNSSGCIDVFCDTVRVSPPNVNFTRAPQEGCAPMTVQFTDATNSIDPIVSWDWDFGNPSVVPPTSTVQNPSANFVNPGGYNVTLIVTTQNGCTDTTTITGAVRVGLPPVSTFTVDKDTVCINEDITFFADSVNDDWEYFWDFQYMAPGNFSMNDDTAFTAYSDTGLYSVALYVDDNGCRDTTIITDMVFVSPPRARFEVSDSVICSLPQTVTITDSSLGPADIYTWFVNGNQYSTLQTPPALTISTPGVYIITQAIENSLSGCTDTFNVAVFAGAPMADFTVDKTLACRGEAIRYFNNSTDAVSYFWTRNLGGTPALNSGSTDFSLAYPDTGLYTVRLIATDAFGCQDTMIRTDYIEVVGPYANFSATPTTGCLPLSVQFTDQSATTNTTTVNQWQWDFGDASAGSTQQNPNHAYNTVGTFDVSLTVEDTQGCRDSLTQPSLIEVTFPSPDFSVNDDTTCVGNLLNFTNLSNGVGMSFLWNFGDNTTSTDPNPSHAYSDTGSYDVTLIATDLNGCVDSITKVAFIHIENFQANFGGDPTIGICPPLNTQFTDSSTGNVVAWNWNFGDGFGASILQDPAYVYFAPGVYDVTLVATHEDGCQDTLTRNSYIQLAGPNGSFSLQPDEACLGDTVCVTVITTGAVSFDPIDWRDGQVETITGLSGMQDTTTVCHLYTSSGDYSPAIVLRDAQGCAFTITAPDSFIIHSLPQAAIVPTDTFGCLPFTVPFQDATILGDTTIAQWDWQFGDGNSDTAAAPIYTYQVDSVMTVNLQVTDFYGCIDSATAQVTTFSGTIADFQASDTVGCSPIDITFSDNSTNVPPTGWTWAFGDGDTLVGSASPTHTYQNDGVYTVTLIVSDGLGCIDTLVKPNYIRLRHPTSVVYADVTQGCNPLEVTFYGDSAVSDTGIVQYEWCLTEINTNQSVCTPTPGNRDSLSINFSEPGNYTMTLIVTDALGCTDTSAAIAIDIDTRVTPGPIEMRNVSVLNDRTVEVKWDPYPGIDFMEYAVYRNNGPNPGLIATITDQNQTSFTETNLSLNTRNNSYCYTVLVQNTCLEYSLLSATEEHCTVDLEASPGLDAIDLSWSAYVGYQVGQYEIYRVTSYDTTTMQLIATVPGNTLSYTDLETFCRDSIYYRLIAIGFGGPQERSYSDISGSDPFHPDPVLSTDVWLATVVNNDFVEISWTPYTGYRPGDYIVQRSIDGQSWSTLDTLPITQNNYQDTTAQVQESAYFYQVFNLDECGDLSAVGQFGRSILLNTSISQSGSIPQLSWNLYEEWPNGVLNYEIQLFNESTQTWDVVDIVAGNQTVFEDNLSRLDQATYCYRIVAYEAGGMGASSMSNESCVTFSPDIFAPNAFTPNNDGNNEVFRVHVPNIGQGELLIYNRWGQLLFRTDSPNTEGWDGTYKNIPVQEGVYVFVVRGTGVDGSVFNRSGTVTLLR